MAEARRSTERDPHSFMAQVVQPLGAHAHSEMPPAVGGDLGRAERCPAPGLTQARRPGSHGPDWPKVWRCPAPTHRSPSPTAPAKEPRSWCRQEARPSAPACWCMGLALSRPELRLSRGICWSVMFPLRPSSLPSHIAAPARAPPSSLKDNRTPFQTWEHDIIQQEPHQSQRGAEAGLHAVSQGETVPAHSQPVQLLRPHGVHFALEHALPTAELCRDDVLWDGTARGVGGARYRAGHGRRSEAFRLK